MAAGEYMSLSVMCVKMKGRIKWSIIPNEESTSGQRQQIPYTPFPYTPVDSKAMWLTWCSSSQASNCNNSDVIVPKVWVNLVP